MEKRARGEIRVRERSDGRLNYSIRFRAGGRRYSVSLGTDRDGWTYRKAERKLDDVLAQVRAGVWKQEAIVRREAVGDETFHEFASRWWTAKRAELRPNTQLDYEWRLTKHLLPFFSEMEISEIDVDAVDRYREAKVAERESVRAAAARGTPLTRKDGQKRVVLSNESINKTLVLLANILDAAVERGGLETNPARGKRRRLKAPRPVRRVLEPDELVELLATAGEMDRSRRRDRQIGRRPMIAVMAKTGLRVTELCQLRWRDVDVHHERLVIEQAKTDAGRRQIDMTLDVVDELNAWRAALIAVAMTNEQSPSLRIEVCFVERERLADPQPGAPEHDDRAAQPDALGTVPGGAHHGNDLLDGWRVGRISKAFVARRHALVEGRCGRR